MPEDKPTYTVDFSKSVNKDKSYTPKVSNLKQRQWNMFVRDELHPSLERDKVTDQMLDSDTPFTIKGVRYNTGKDYTDKLLNEYVNTQGWSSDKDLSVSDVADIQETFNNIITSTKSLPEDVGNNYVDTYLNQSVKKYGLDTNNLSPVEGRIGSITKKYYFPVNEGTHPPSGVIDMTKNIDTFYPPNFGMQKGFAIDDQKNTILPTDWGKYRIPRDTQTKFTDPNDVNSPRIKRWTGGVPDYVTFEDGGKLGSAEQMQATKKLLLQNKDKEFVKRIFDPNTMAPVNLGGGETGTHLMGWSSDDEGHVIYPTIVNVNGKLTQLSDDDAYNYAKKTGEFIRTPDAKLAEYIAGNGYKESAGWNKETFESGGKLTSEEEEKKKKQPQTHSTLKKTEKTIYEPQTHSTLKKTTKKIYNKLEEGGELEEEVEVTGNGELEEVSEEISKAKGPSHEKGGIDLNTGDEIRGEETVNVKKGMVFSASLINPDTNRPFAKDHEELAKMMKELEGRKEGWAVRKLGVLKEKEHELFEKQQELNGHNGEDEEEVEMEDGGLTDGDPPVKAKSKVPQIRYFVANGEQYEVNPKKYDQFIKDFPDAKEYIKKSDNTFVEATSTLATAGQKKNGPLSKAATTTKSTVKPTISATDESVNTGSSTITELDLDKIREKLPTLLSDKSNIQLDVNEAATVDYFKGVNKLIADKTKELQPGAYNIIIEEGIQEKNKGLWGDFYINEANPEVEKIKEEYGDNYDIVKFAAQNARYNDNYLVASLIIPYIKKDEESILTSARTGSRTSKGDTNVFRENIQETSAFKDKVDYYLNTYKGMKIKRPDGTVLDTDNITESQRDEIRQQVSNMYQAKNAIDVGIKNTQEKVTDAFNGVNLDDPEVAFIKTQGIDKGIIPLSTDQWDTYSKAVDEVSTQYAPLIANADKLIENQTNIFKQSYQNEIAEFSNLIKPDFEKYKLDLETQVANNIITEKDANLKFDEYKKGIAEKESQIFTKWNAKTQQFVQATVKDLDKGINEELQKKLKGTLFEKMDLENIDEDFINKSVKAFSDLTLSRVDLKMADNADYLKKMAATSWDKLDWQAKFAQEGLRGSLQTVEGLTGILSFSGGFETMNVINDYIDDYNLKAPKKELGHFTINSLLDPDYWWQTYAPMLGQQIVMAPLTFVGGGVGGKIVSKVGLTGIQAGLAQGTVAQLAQRPLTAFVNAGSYYNELRNNGVGELEAGELTSKDLSKQFGLIVVDLIQSTFAFTPLGKLNPIVATLTKAGVESGIEGLSEVAEAVPEQEGLVDNPVYSMNEIVRSDLFSDNFSAGAIGSFMFSGASVFPDIASQITNNNKKYTQNVMFNMMQGPDMGKRYQDLTNSLDVLRIRGTLTEKQYVDAKNILDFSYSKGREIPANLTPTTKNAILGALSDINIKQQELAVLTEPTLIKAKNSEITGLESIVKNLMAGNEPTYFIGNISYPKEQFDQLIENPDVANQIINGETTVGVYNDEATLTKIQKLYDPKNSEGVQGSIQDGEEPITNELDKGASGEEIGTGGVVQDEEIVITPEDQEFIDTFEEAKSYTGLRKIEAMDELKTKNSAKFAQATFIDENLDVIVEKMNIKKDCK